MLPLLLPRIIHSSKASWMRARVRSFHAQSNWFSFIQPFSGERVLAGSRAGYEDRLDRDDVAAGYDPLAL